MHKFHFVVRLLTAGIFMGLLFGGCAVWHRFFAEKEKTPAELMSEGLRNMERGYYEDAANAFQKIKDRYPYSRFAVKAELNLADSLYKRELYDEAFDSYGEFERLHPKNSNIPYVIYQRGICNFNQVDTIDRDQSHTLKAKDEFERIAKRFPKSDYAHMARMKTRKCYEELAEHELYVGKFYYKMGKYRAAMGRYRYILENYPDLGQYHEALEGLRKCEQEIAREQEKH